MKVDGLLPSLLRALFVEMVFLAIPVKIALSADPPIELRDINKKIETPSHTAKNLFAGEGDANSEGTVFRHAEFQHHMHYSRINFIRLQIKVRRAISKGRFVHIEDGESDDIWHDELQARTGVTPPKVFLVGGYHKVRRACAIEYWRDICHRNGVDRPHIMTMAGTMEGHSPFDEAEGVGLLETSEIVRLKNESVDSEDGEYLQSTQEAREELERTLQENDFTVLLLKSAPPYGLADILQNYQHKFAIIWTGAVREKRSPGSYEVRYNFYRAPTEADAILELQAPIIIMSNLLDNTDMNSIVDQTHMETYRNFVRTSPSYDGFRDLLRVPQDKENNLFWYYIPQLSRKMKQKLIDDYFRESERLMNLEQEVNHIAQAKIAKWQARLNKIWGRDEVKAQRIQEELASVNRWWEAKLFEITQEKNSKLPLGQRMLEISQIHPDFLEYCPLDQTLVVLTDRSLNADLEEVIEVSMERPVQDQNSREITITPQIGGNTFIIGSFKSTGLQHRIQQTIDYPQGRFSE